MNDSLDAFELQLRRLKPAAPAPELRERIASALPTRPATAPERVPAWREFLDRWIGPTPSLAWKCAAAAVAIAVLFAAIFISRMEVSPASSMGDVSPRFNDRMQGTTAAATENSAPSNYQLARAESESQAVLDEGFVHDETGALARRVRMQFIDTLEWRDADTGAQIVVSVPREELFSSQVRAF